MCPQDKFLCSNSKTIKKYNLATVVRHSEATGVALFKSCAIQSLHGSVSLAGCGPVVGPRSTPPLRVCASWATGEASLPFLHLMQCLCKTCWFNPARVPSNVPTPPKPNRKWGHRLTTHREGGGQRSVCGGAFCCSRHSTRIPFCNVGPGWLSLRLRGDSFPPRALPTLASSWPRPQSCPVPPGNVARSGCLWPRCGPSSSLWSSSFLAGPRQTSGETAWELHRPFFPEPESPEEGEEEEEEEKEEETKRE